MAIFQWLNELRFKCNNDIKYYIMAHLLMQGICALLAYLILKVSDNNALLMVPVAILFITEGYFIKESHINIKNWLSK
jgi:hypothetical protein